MVWRTIGIVILISIVFTTGIWQIMYYIGKKLSEGADNSGKFKVPKGFKVYRLSDDTREGRYKIRHRLRRQYQTSSSLFKHWDYVYYLGTRNTINYTDNKACASAYTLKDAIAVILKIQLDEKKETKRKIPKWSRVKYL